MPEERFLKSEDVRTMKKDIARLQKSGTEKPPAVSIFDKPKKVKEKVEIKKKEDVLKMDKEAMIEKKEDVLKIEERFKKEIWQKKEKKRIEDIEENKIKQALIEEKRKREERAQKIQGLKIREKEEKEKIEAKREKEEKKTIKGPEQKKKFLLEEKAKLREEKNRIDRDFENLIVEKRPLDVKKAALLKEVDILHKSFDIIAQREESMKERGKSIEKREAAAKTPEERRNIEKERWSVEERIRELEKRRWPWDEKLRMIKEKIEEVDSEYSGTREKEAELRKRQEKIKQREENIEIEIERIDLEEKLQRVRRLKEPLDKSKAEFSEELSRAEKKLEMIIGQEKGIEEDKRLIEQEEEMAKDFKNRRKLEEERWEVEEKRRKIESERWEAEKEKEKKEVQQKKIEHMLKEFLDQESDINKRIEKINQTLGPEKAPVPLKEAVEKPVLKKKDKVVEKPVLEEKDKGIEEAKKRIEALKRMRQASLEKPKEIKEPRIEQRREDFKKEEQKREELSKRLHPEKEVKKHPVPLVSPVPTDTPSLPKKPPFMQKIWVRILIFILVLILLAGVSSFWYWYLEVRQKSTPEPEEQEPEPLPVGIVIPDSLFKNKLDSEKNLNLLSSSEVDEKLIQVIQEEQEIGTFKRLIIIDKEEKKAFNIEEFLKSLQVRTPEDFYQKIESNFTLFAYSQAEGIRIGFVVKVKDRNGLITMLNSNEANFKNDFNNFFSLMEEIGVPISPVFKQASNVRGYDGPNFRYQTLTEEDIGICYLVLGNHFLFTSSWQSMVEVIKLDLLP